MITPEIIDRIYSFQLGPADVDDITAGLFIFLIVTGTSEANAQNRARVHVWELLQAGQTTATVDQLRELVPSAPQMARTLLSLSKCFQAYSTLLDVLLGCHHRVALHFRAHLVDPFVQSMLELEPLVTPAMLPLFQRHTQLAFARFFRSAGFQGDLTPLPPVQDLMDIIAFRRWNTLPSLPPRYLAPLAAPPRGAAAPGPGPAAAPALASSAGPPARLTNTAPNLALQQRFTKCGKPLPALIQGHSAAIPKLDDGSIAVCLSWLLRGYCNDKCQRKTAHRPLSAAELASVNVFLSSIGCE